MGRREGVRRNAYHLGQTKGVAALQRGFVNGLGILGEEKQTVARKGGNSSNRNDINPGWVNEDRYAERLETHRGISSSASNGKDLGGVALEDLDGWDHLLVACGIIPSRSSLFFLAPLVLNVLVSV